MKYHIPRNKQILKKMIEGSNRSQVTYKKFRNELLELLNSQNEDERKWNTAFQTVRPKNVST